MLWILGTSVGDEKGTSIKCTSKNIINAVKFCKKNKIKTVGLSGFNGGYLAKNADISLHLKCENYGISEDSHHVLMHVVIQFLRQKYLKSNIKKTIF